MFRKKMDRRIAEYQNDLITKHCDEVENIYRVMRGWRHDYHNHLQAIKAYIALGEVDALLRYCDGLEQDLKEIDTIVKTGNVMLDAVLNSKLSLAKSRGIEVHCAASVPRQLGIADVDFCVLMGNLLDNAMEACTGHSDDTEYDHPFIRVYIGMKGKHLYICVTNTVYGKVIKSGSRFISTKNSETHGFGLLRIDKICQKYGGYCKRGSEPGAFTTEILLPVE